MRGKRALLLGGTLVLAVFVFGSRLRSASPPKREPVPYHQDTMPGPALTPQQAIAKMTVPPGFRVELVASEPDIVNPVAMTFDERGRIWITESLEYPRRSSGPGRDRVKILEDTDGDGKIDRVTVFAEGLNIPSGIAVGNGGVYVANSPDILFYKIGPDGKAAGKPEVIVTGFGRHDTHELPNSLTWGPDGYLYGLNGVFNPGHVKQKGKHFDFTCTLFRIHPKTHEFQLFCEGTSNPWGIAWDNDGSAFVSACVIDHLWHLVETGYYIRQGGPYPPFTWPQGSIVHHKHQKAAYCGIHFFDSDAYPPAYRERLYMGNIHGGCINVDVLSRAGSTYDAKPAPDFLVAHDPWFMPVVQKTGPDGCLYILDWYDRYHCYQDANRDPAGIDRRKGRLYRIRYKDTPRAPKFDLGKESDERLIERLHSGNVYFRDLAQRLLRERNNPATRARLEKLVLDDHEPRKARMHALWVLVGTGTLSVGFHERLLDHRDPALRAWGVRAAGSFGSVADSIRARIAKLARDPAPDVQLQVAIAARKVRGLDAAAVLVDVLRVCGDDRLIPHIVWQNLHPLLEKEAGAFVAALEGSRLQQWPALARLLPRVVERILARRATEPRLVLALFRVLARDGGDASAACKCLAVLAGKLQTGELAGKEADALRQTFRADLQHFIGKGTTGPLRLEAAILAVTLKDTDAREIVRAAFASKKESEETRLRAFAALVAARDRSVLDATAAVLSGPRESASLRGKVLAALGKLDDARVGPVVLDAYPRLEPSLQPQAIELLTERPAWGKALLRAIAEKKVLATALSANQLRKLLATKDADIVKQVKAQWGQVREERNPEREKVVQEMKKLLQRTRGDARAGQVVFKNLCAQCHKIHGEGVEVGPDLTANGRSSFDQLLSNVFDPSLVIGPAYQATTVTTTRGRVVTGLLVEDNPARVVLRTQGAKLETIPRRAIEDMRVSKVSLMPEGIEKQLKRQEIVDLFAFLILDRPPGAPNARKIPGAPR